MRIRIWNLMNKIIKFYNWKNTYFLAQKLRYLYLCLHNGCHCQSYISALRSEHPGTFLTFCGPFLRSADPFIFLWTKSFRKYAFHMLKYSYVGKGKDRVKPMRIWIRNTAFFLANLRIYGLGHQGNLRICDLSLQICGFADWHT
jgi:hypothetical protein